MKEESERVKYILNNWTWLQTAREYEKLEEENKRLKQITKQYNAYEEPTPEDTRIVIADSVYFCSRDIYKTIYR